MGIPSRMRKLPDLYPAKLRAGLNQCKPLQRLSAAITKSGSLSLKIGELRGGAGLRNIRDDRVHLVVFEMRHGRAVGFLPSDQKKPVSDRFERDANCLGTVRDGFPFASMPV